MASKNLLIFILCVSQIYINLALDISCTSKSTPEPTLNPTTADPTTTTSEPTPMIYIAPTKAPFKPESASEEEGSPETSPPTATVVSIAACSQPRTDYVILNDISCPMTVDNCEYHQQQLVSILNSLKDVESGNADAPSSRVSYIEFDSTNISIIVPLDHDYNTLPVTTSDMDAFDTRITNAGHCDDAETRASHPNLKDAIKSAFEEFTQSDPDSFDLKKQTKILIYSHCRADNITEICTDWGIQDYLGNNAAASQYSGVNIVMVNIGDTFEDDAYILCLVEYDPQRIFNFDVSIDTDSMMQIRNEMCEEPTPAPTTDPTRDPTEAGRRLLEIEEEYDITSGYDGTPCIEMNIKIETENLLPLNSNPDPVTNIMVIAAAIADGTLGKVTMPESWDPEEDDTTPDPNVIWNIDTSCDDSVSQMNRTWMVSTTHTYTLLLVIEDEGTDGFIITSDLLTVDSIMYMTHLSSLPLPLSHDCDDDLLFGAAVYLDDVLVATAENVSVSAGESNHTFEFTSTVELSPGILYQIRMYLIGGYPDGCSYSNIDFGESTRRRLGDADVATTEVASACLLGQTLAKSPSMQVGASVMCSDSIGDTTQYEIEESLFRTHISTSAIQNYLFSLGSLHLYDENGTETFVTEDFPGQSVEDPCIAVDEDNLIVFAIGGHIDGTATKLIQAYQFTDDTLQEGTVLDVGTWELDIKRYGSMCLFWEENIIVISGMETTEEEFENRGDWHKDIRLFPVPDLIYDQSKVSGSTSDTYVSPSLPYSGTYAMEKNIIDGKPLLYDNHILYLFGGKTHKNSKAYVSKFDLNDIGSVADDSNLLIVQSMELADDRALPLLDTVLYDDECCYIIFNGQQYADYESVDSDSNLLQMFCNADINDCDDTRRRMGEEDRPMLTAFDREMMKESQRRSARRLQADDDDADSEVVISWYDMNELDDIWYNFSVNFEICYANNSMLSKAENEYTAVIDGKESDSAEWAQYKEEIAEKILNVSVDAYKGWSNGFGAVNVWDLTIIDVRYEDTPSPTEKKAVLSHPQRRKARFWRSIEEREHDCVWIDDLFADSNDDETYDNEG